MAGVAQTNSSNTADADGVATVFNYTFFVYSTDDIKVYSVLNDVLTPITTGITKVINSNFIGGTVTFNTAPADAVGDILIRREVPYTQETELADITRYKETAIEAALNTLVLQTQQLAAELNRCLKFNETASTSDTTVEEPTDDSTLVFDGILGRVRGGATSTEIENAAAEAAAAAASASASAASAAAAAASAAAAATFNPALYAALAGATFTGAVNVPAGATGSNAPRVSEVLEKAGGTMTGKLITALSAAIAGAGFNVGHGVAPNSPANGDIWSTTAGLFARINGVTERIDITQHAIGTLSKTLTDASTSQSITGLGFQPRVVLLFGATSTNGASMGMSNGSNHYVAVDIPSTGWAYVGTAAISLASSSGNFQGGTLAMTSGGFDITWTKTGSPTGTANVFYIAIR